MAIGVWRTRSVFERYNIKNQADSVDALEKLELSKVQRLGKIEAERWHEERNPTFDFGTNWPRCGGIGASAKPQKVN
jgi:hypothetical protein